MEDFINHTFFEKVFQMAFLMTETGIDVRQRCRNTEKSLNHLKTLFQQTYQDVENLQLTSRYFLQQAKNLLSEVNIVPLASKTNYEKLIKIIDRQLTEFESLGDNNESEIVDMTYITEKIKFLEEKHQVEENFIPTGSNKSVKNDIDEKYPENWSKDSSIDLNSVVNLPPVPEDIFITFNATNRPIKSSSLSSLKSMRKVKLCLQKVDTSDDDCVSSDDNRECCQKGDSDDTNSPKAPLRNITEEVVQI